MRSTRSAAATPPPVGVLALRGARRARRDGRSSFVVASTRGRRLSSERRPETARSTLSLTTQSAAAATTTTADSLARNNTHEIATEAAPSERLPDKVTAIERSTRLRDAISLMLGNELLYAPVTKCGGQPLDVVSMRDINLFLAPSEGG